MYFIFLNIVSGNKKNVTLKQIKQRLFCSSITFTLWTVHWSEYNVYCKNAFYNIPFAVKSVQGSMNSVQFTLSTVHCTLDSVHCTLYTAHCTLHTVHCTLHTVNYTLSTVHCTLFTVHCTLYTGLWTLYTVHCTLHTVHCTLCTVHCTLYTVTNEKPVLTSVQSVSAACIFPVLFVLSSVLPRVSWLTSIATGTLYGLHWHSGP